MKYEIFTILSLILISFICLSSVSAHGADITEETMVIANGSNGMLAKGIIDNLGLNISVYKFTSDGDVEHQLEHALANPNKRILAIAYQGTVNDFLSKNPNLKNRILVSDDDKESIEFAAKELVSIDITSNSNNSDFITPLIVGLVIGLALGLVSGVFLMKRKIN